MTANEVSGIIAILAVFALAGGSMHYYRQAQHLRPPDPDTPQDYEDLGERVWVNWDDPEVWVWHAERVHPTRVPNPPPEQVAAFEKYMRQEYGIEPQVDENGWRYYEREQIEEAIEREQTLKAQGWPTHWDGPWPTAHQVSP